MRETVLMTMALTQDRLALGNELTFPRLRAYAERYGMDFCIIDTCRRANEGKIYDWERADALYELLGRYERVIHAEDDVIVRRDADDLCQLPRNVFYGFDNCSLNEAEVDRCLKECRSFWPEEFSGVRELCQLYNNGLFVADKSHRELFAPAIRERYEGWQGMGFMNMRLQKFGMRSTDPGPHVFNQSNLWREGEAAPDFLHVIWYEGTKREGVEKFIRRMDA